MTMRCFERVSLLSILGVALASGFAPHAQATPFQYRYDDGTGTSNIWPNFGNASLYPAELMWGNVYTVQPGANVITTISVAFGRINAPQARPVRLSLYQVDASGDPRNSTLLVSVNGTSSLPQTNTFIDYAIPATTVTGRFFVAVTMTIDASSTSAPARLDAGGAANASNAWLFAATSLENLPLANASFVRNMTQNAIQGAFMVRATAIPTPGAVTLLALGGLLACPRRRR